MSRGEAYRHIRLLDASGRPIADPFLELDEELWSGDGKRFTLLFDPGRIKRGLKPREEVGPVLDGGAILRAGRRSAAGPTRPAIPSRPDSARRSAPDPPTRPRRTRRPGPSGPPAPMTRAPLEVRFPEPLDRALLDRLHRRPRRFGSPGRRLRFRLRRGDALAIHPGGSLAARLLSPRHRHRAGGRRGQQHRPAVRGRRGRADHPADRRRDGRAAASGSGRRRDDLARHCSRQKHRDTEVTVHGSGATGVRKRAEIRHGPCPCRRELATGVHRSGSELRGSAVSGSHGKSPVREQ